MRRTWIAQTIPLSLKELRNHDCKRLSFTHDGTYLAGVLYDDLLELYTYSKLHAVMNAIIVTPTLDNQL